MRCKMAARGSSDWHGLILGGRALDCASRMGLGFRPGPEHHILDTLSIRIARCEDYTGSGRTGPMPLRRACPPWTGLVLVPVEREVQSSADGSLTEAVFFVVSKQSPVFGRPGPERDSFSSRPRSSTTRSSLATLSQRSGQVW